MDQLLSLYEDKHLQTVMKLINDAWTDDPSMRPDMSLVCVITLDLITIT